MRCLLFGIIPVRVSDFPWEWAIIKQTLWENSKLINGTRFISTNFWSSFITINSLLDKNWCAFKINLKQRKNVLNKLCFAEVRWENEPVRQGYFNCLSYESTIGLYVAGIYPSYINGQVRNFIYMKK